MPAGASVIYGSVCSGIEAATVAWEPLGWEPAFFSEIEPFPRAVLLHHYPVTPLHGDFTTIEPGQYAAIDLLVGGTPCQDFSVAGLRAGIAGDRGRLTVEYCNLAGRLRPRWLVWENVPGVLSADDGNAFGIFLGALAELGYGTAYRVLDAQHFGVPQRRRRVFVVGHSGGLWQRAAAVLFERESLSWHPAPGREAWQSVAGTLEAGLGSRGHDEQATYVSSVAPCLTQNYGKQPDNSDTSAGPMLVAFNNTGAGFWTPASAAATVRCGDPNGNGGARESTLLAFTHKDHGADASDIAPTLRSLGEYDANDGSQLSVATSSAVRRLTPRECERLQGFPDDYTLVLYRNKPAVDGPRYKALGNSMAVPVMRWLGERIAMVESLVAA